MDAVVIGAASGGGGLVLLVLCCICLPLFICCCIRCKKSSSASIMNSSQFPKFRVIDAPNPSFIKIDKPLPDSSSSYVDPLDSSSPYHQCVDDDEGIDGRSPAKLPSKVSSTEDKSVSEYSYALPNEIRVIPSFMDKGSRELLTESAFNNSMESSPIRRSSNCSPNPPPQIDNYGSCADYSSPIAGSPSSSPTAKSPNSTSNTISESNDPHSFYMTPATSEESLYQQIKSMKVPYISKDTIMVRGELGSGNFGCVLRCSYSQSTSTTLDVAAKTLKEKYATMDKIRFLQEAAIMGQFHHKNIVKLHGVIVEDKPLMIVLELMPNGDLRNHLVHINPSNHDRLPETLLTFCRQISSGMEYLSSKSFIHRDLAARNILLSKHLVCKIGDFGLARDLMDEEYYIAHGGVIPVRWTAPEAINYRKYSTASDVWSYGCLMYEIWSLGHKPYGRKTNTEVLKMVEEGARLPPPPGCSRILYHIMIECWHPSTSCRPSFTDISGFLDDTNEDLLSWTEEDQRSVPPEATILGSSLAISEGLFIDLQLTYTSV